MSKETDLQNLPNGVTKQDLDDQTAQVQKGVAESVQAVADHLDVRVDEVHTAFVETVEAVKEGLAEQSSKVESQLRIDALIEKTVADDARIREALNRRFRGYQRGLIAVFSLMFVVSAVTFWLYINPQAGQSLFILSDLKVIGSTDLCPGETLDFEFNVLVKEVGVYQIYMSTWKTDPPPSTIIFSEFEPFVIGSARSFPVSRKWEIPFIIKNPTDGIDMPMTPGEYIRDISVIAVGKNTEAIPLQVIFRIKEDCSKR